MREFLLQFMGEDAAMGVQFLVALLVVLMLFGIFIWFLRMITGSSRRPRKTTNEQRLAVLDRTQIDENRSLLLVRRDDVEHLVMVGGPSDVVVEANINLDEEDEFDDFVKPQPGHEIARRVIAQRPLRTMSLASSSASVAESIGLGASSRPDVTIAPPPPPLSTSDVAEEPAPAPVAPVAVAAPVVAQAPTPMQIAEIPAVEVPPQPLAPVAEPAAPAVAPIAPAPELAPHEPAMAEVAPPAAPPVAHVQVAPVPVAESQLVEPLAPAPVEPSPSAVDFQSRAVAEPEMRVQTPAPQAVQMPDLAAQLEDALNLELGQDTNPNNSTLRNGERSAQQTRNLQQQNVSTGGLTMDEQKLSQNQEADLSAGFAAAMALDMGTKTASAPAQQQAREVISEVALEDAIADMLRSDGPTDTATYTNGNNDVYSSSESVPSGSERLVDTTRPGRVDDEMSRLLQELAVPGRA